MYSRNKPFSKIIKAKKMIYSVKIGEDVKDLDEIADL